MSVAVNLDRSLFIAETMVGDDWSPKRVGTLVGCAWDGDAARVRQVFDSDTRDVLRVLQDRIVIVRPKTAAKLGLIAGLRAARGHVAGLGTMTTYPLSSVTGLTIDDAVPDAVNQSGLPCAHIGLSSPRAGISVIDFLVDQTALDPGAIVANVRQWLPR